jgi:hypothetical protein
MHWNSFEGTTVELRAIDAQFDEVSTWLGHCRLEILPVNWISSAFKWGNFINTKNKSITSRRMYHFYWPHFYIILSSNNDILFRKLKELLLKSDPDKMCAVDPARNKLI